MGSRATCRRATCPSISVSEARTTPRRSRCGGPSPRAGARRSLGLLRADRRSTWWSRSGLGEPPPQTRVGVVPDDPQLGIRAGGGGPVSRRRRRPAQAKQRQRPLGSDLERARELALRFPRPARREQHLPEQLVRRLHVGGWAILDRHLVFQNRCLAYQPQGVRTAAVNLAEQRLQLFLKNTGHRIPLVPGCGRGPVTVEVDELRYRLRGSGALPAFQ